MKNLLSVCLLLVLTCSLLGQDQVVSSAANPQNGCDETAKLSKKKRSIENETFKFLNQKRIEKGLEPLYWSEELAKIARLHSENMAKLKFFSHTDLDKNTVIERAKSLGIKQWKAIGENIGYVRNVSNVVVSLYEEWIKSEPHRKNIFSSNYKETGIGVAITEDGTYYFTQVLIER
jgi:uncharacterized protein YkwD